MSELVTGLRVGGSEGKVDPMMEEEDVLNLILEIYPTPQLTNENNSI